MERIAKKLGTLALGLAIAPPSASAQPVVTTPLEATGGSELERYFRATSLLGAGPGPGLAVRGYGPRELEALARDALAPGAASPWRDRIRPAGRCRAQVALLPVSARGVWNADFPFALNDGAVIVGRGITASATAGVAACVGPLSAVVVPVAFSARNLPFPIVAPTPPGISPFASATLPYTIDAPQRFGDAPLRRVDPGQTTIRLDVGPIAVGWSTASESWGPAAVHPLVMSQNAPGFRHVFLGTSGLQPIWIGRVSARLTLGRPVDSPYAPPESRPRELVGGVFSFAPRFLPDLELGLTRVFHTFVPPGGVEASDIFAAVESFYQGRAARLRKNDPSSPDYRPDNQVASMFGSWTFRRAGLRVYGELFKNDNAIDVRDLIVEPDHDAAFVLGLEHAISRAPDGRRLVVATLETVNARVTHLTRIRQQANPYEHGIIVQGHTNRGVILGSPAAYGGGGQHFGVDSYTPRGRVSFFADRLLRQEVLVEGEPPGGWDVQRSAGAEILRFAGPLEWSASARYVREANRDHLGDASSWRLGAGVTWRPGLGWAAGRR